MEHHTYAKRGSKKWSVEEKRLLVSKRIEAEDLFAKYSHKQCEPWKRFKNMAKIGDYSEHALRKQWLNMVQLYRIQKSNMKVTPLSKQCIDVLNEEWEFFGEIHAYMTQRTTDLHSYALKEPNIEQTNNNLAMRGIVNDHSFGEQCSSSLKNATRTVYRRHDAKNYQPHSRAVSISDELAEQDAQLLALEKTLTVDSEYAAVAGEISPLDIYTDTDSQQSSEPSDPVAVEISDFSEVDSIQDALLPVKTEIVTAEPKNFDRLSASSGTASIKLEEHATSDRTNNTPQTAAARPPKRKRQTLSEREKYYRHRRRYEHRMELRLGGLCEVAGQLLDCLVPGFNVLPLLINVYNNVENSCDSSCEEDDSDSAEDEGEVDGERVGEGSVDDIHHQ